jgi:hypothetical protein
MVPGNSSSNKVSLPKLQDDGSNWVMYKERIKNHLTSKGLMRHLTGTARKPAEVEEKDGKVHKKGNARPMTDDELDTYLDTLDVYATKEAQVREVLYDTLSKTVFLQIKGQPTAAETWNKLVSIFELKGDMTITDTLTKLASARYVDGNDMRTHISTLLELRERLAEMGHTLSDQQFSAYIRTSLTPNYRPLLTSLTAASRAVKQTLDSDVLIQAILDEADNKTAEKNVDDARENAAMLAGKREDKGGTKEDKAKIKCGNCKRKGHSEGDCFWPGGGKEGDAPEWWEEKFGKGRKTESEDKSPIVNAVDEEMYAFLVDIDDVALVCTSDFQDGALEANFVGSDDESMDFSTYSPTDQKLSTEHDIFTNKPEMVWIEGENLKPAEKVVNPPTSNPYTSKSIENHTPSQIYFPYEQASASDHQRSSSHRGTCARIPTGFYSENQQENANKYAHLATTDKGSFELGGAEIAPCADTLELKKVTKGYLVKHRAQFCCPNTHCEECPSNSAEISPVYSE